MVSQEAVRTVVGIMGNIISFCLFIAPAPTFYKIVKQGAVEEFSPNPYLATIMNCMLWVFYGMPFVHPNSTLVITINGFGCFIEAVYVTLYIMYATKKQRAYVFKVIAVELVFYVAVIALTLNFVHGTERRTTIVGIFCVVFNIGMYAMPLDVMKLVITTKSVEYMPFAVLVANFFNGLVWVTYAQLVKFDLFITISNGMGTILGTIQLLLYAIYYKTTPKKGSNNANNGVQLSEKH